ncbi:unnamed protein product [Miscanthus lutarioriparius]|uniref:FYVE-type domain-containing protein n=1 Tax=Miscanthus lutarioriparius TaxID=422564 RepID=A0A811NMD2_9POAL|nr:unnamed protein product [Miscanthus lutarioriparius]
MAHLLPFLFLKSHHCRRCGGVFCNSCTQQRMVLRGQGDSPVRICDPCKKLEEAARYELRYGHKNIAARATTKATSKPEDEILSEILGGDGVQIQVSGKESLNSEFPGISAISASSSGSSSRRTTANLSMDTNGDERLSAEAHDFDLNNTASVFTPEELRQQAVEEKKRYKTLKSEGKPDEALRVFKHGKELERQAAALELELRKSRRMATRAPNVAAAVSTPTTDSFDESETKKYSAGKRVKKEKNDLASELRDLGLSDADLRDETKAAPMSVEGELSQLLREVAPKSSEGKKTGGIDKSQVNALKRQALLLKREGRLAEAKEELKKAKILEKQLEEQEILGEAEDSDDDLAAIIRNMDDDKHDDIWMDDPNLPAFNFEQILGASNDLAIDGHFDVTDDDMNDPDMAAALKSFGWSEEDDKQLEHHEPVSSSNQDVLKEQVLALKKEVVANRRSGNVAEAMTLLKKAKLLEKDLETEEPESKVASLEGQKTMLAEDVTFAGMTARPVLAHRSKLAIQRELLALKKKALALRREGKVDESEEELKKGSLLEKQLEELENASKPPVVKETRSFASNPPYKVEPPSLNLADEGYEPEVTDNDMQDPALLSMLKNMGWEDVDTDSAKRNDNPSICSHVVHQKSSKTKVQLQKELLGIKRKALALRREGKNIEAEEELEKAKVLEQQLAEINSTASQGVTTAGHQIVENKFDVQHVSSIDATVPTSSVTKTMKWDDILQVHGSEPGISVDSLGDSPSKLQVETTGSKQIHVAKESSDGASSALWPAYTNSVGSEKGSHSPSELRVRKEPHKTHGDDILTDEILFHKRKAVAFKREGKMAEAREELKLARLLEKRLEGAQQDSMDGGDNSITPAGEQSTVVQQRASSGVASGPPAQESKSMQPQRAMSSRDRLKIQRESLAHKRSALKLRREGKIAEADAEFELAKELESQLEEPDNQGSSSGGKSGEPNDAMVEELLDPQIMSALKSIGWSDMDLSMQSSSAQPPKPLLTSKSQPPQKVEVKPAITVTIKPHSERSQLEEQIKVEKQKALNLKREGKQAEALEALRSAKRLEKKLSSLS